MTFAAYYKFIFATANDMLQILELAPNIFYKQIADRKISATKISSQCITPAIQ